MSALQIFQAPEGQEIRIIEQGGEFLWVAKDVLLSLGYTWGGDRISHVPEEWRGVRSVRTHSGDQDMAILTEQGLYFFLGRSDKLAALPFQKWIAGEVIPSIRKTGGYQLAPLSRVEMARRQLEAEERAEADAKARAMAEEKLEAARPAIEFTEKYQRADGLYAIREVAKMMGIPSKRFFQTLHKLGYIHRLGGDWAENASPKTRGMFFSRPHILGSGRTVRQLMVTPHGHFVIESILKPEAVRALELVA